MLANNLSPSSVPTSEPFPCTENGTATNKRKRRPAGTPDPDAEVVSLSPKTLLESDRYVCEICNQGFQRDQNLQMHRRRHKKHFRRKHSNHKQWVCERCSKGYAVQSDYKAHLKTCGTRGHSCDCGRVFSRTAQAQVLQVNQFQHSSMANKDDNTKAIRNTTIFMNNPITAITTAETSPRATTNYSTPTWIFNSPPPPQLQHLQHQHIKFANHCNAAISPKRDHYHENHSTHLQLSIGSSDMSEKNDQSNRNSSEKSSKQQQH
ncbi:hypothetical protein JHK82_018116 [Glycine max]|nr:hypothetical protein JHK82_018116 [Glycine max]